MYDPDKVYVVGMVSSSIGRSRNRWVSAGGEGNGFGIAIGG